MSHLCLQRLEIPVVAPSMADQVSFRSKCPNVGFEEAIHQTVVLERIRLVLFLIYRWG